MKGTPRTPDPARRWIAAGLLALAAAGCGADANSPAASPVTPPPTTPAPESPDPPAGPPIELTPVDRGIATTSEGQIVVELTPEDLVPANPLDLAGKTLMFTPDGRGGYARRLQEVAWEEDIGRPVDDNDEVELSFRFAFSGRTWDSVFVSRYGLVTFGEPYPFPQVGPDRWGTMAAIALTPTPRSSSRIAKACRRL